MISIHDYVYMVTKKSHPWVRYFRSCGGGQSDCYSNEEIQKRVDDMIQGNLCIKQNDLKLDISKETVQHIMEALDYRRISTTTTDRYHQWTAENAINLRENYFSMTISMEDESTNLLWAWT